MQVVFKSRCGHLITSTYRIKDLTLRAYSRCSSKFETVIGDDVVNTDGVELALASILIASGN